MTVEKQEVRKGPFARFIPDGVRSGDLITLSGQVSIDASGAVVAPGDLVGQTHQVYGLIGAILSEFGATMENAVDEMWLVTDIADAMAKSREMFALGGEVYGDRAAGVADDGPGGGSRDAGAADRDQGHRPRVIRRCGFAGAAVEVCRRARAL